MWWWVSGSVGGVVVVVVVSGRNGRRGVECGCGRNSAGLLQGPTLALCHHEYYLYYIHIILLHPGVNTLMTRLLYFVYTNTTPSCLLYGPYLGYRDTVHTLSVVMLRTVVHYIVHVLKYYRRRRRYPLRLFKNLHVLLQSRLHNTPTVVSQEQYNRVRFHD